MLNDFYDANVAVTKAAKRIWAQRALLKHLVETYLGRSVRP